MFHVNEEFLAKSKEATQAYIDEGLPNCDSLMIPMIEFIQGLPNIATRFCCSGHTLAEQEAKNEEYKNLQEVQIIFVGNEAGIAKIMETFDLWINAMSFTNHLKFRPDFRAFRLVEMVRGEGPKPELYKAVQVLVNYNLVHCTRDEAINEFIKFVKLLDDQPTAEVTDPMEWTPMQRMMDAYTQSSCYSSDPKVNEVTVNEIRKQFKLGQITFQPKVPTVEDYTARLNELTEEDEAARKKKRERLAYIVTFLHQHKRMGKLFVPEGILTEEEARQINESGSGFDSYSIAVKRMERMSPKELMDHKAGFVSGGAQFRDYHVSALRMLFKLPEVPMENLPVAAYTKQAFFKEVGFFPRRMLTLLEIGKSKHDGSYHDLLDKVFAFWTNELPDHKALLAWCDRIWERMAVINQVKFINEIRVEHNMVELPWFECETLEDWWAGEKHEFPEEVVKEIKAGLNVNQAIGRLRSENRINKWSALVVNAAILTEQESLSIKHFPQGFQVFIAYRDSECERFTREEVQATYEEFKVLPEKEQREVVNALREHLCLPHMPYGTLVISKL